MVELVRDVAGQLDVLLLVLADRHMGRLVREDVGRHQRRVGIKAERNLFGVLAGLVLELGHPVHPAEPCDAVEYPAQFGMGRDLALVEQDGFFRVQTASDIGRGKFAGIVAQGGRFLPDGNGVQIDHAIDSLDA